MNIQERFQKFDGDNPHIYAELVALTRQAYERGRKKIGMKMLFEILRWNRLINTTGKDFKLSNDFTSRYSRKIMSEYPELDGMFDIKELTA